MALSPLPIDAVLPQVIAALREAGAVVLRAPTGAGKTTRVPPAILDAGLAAAGSIIVLQPRRLAARACARRMAVERGVKLGDEVGYQVRFDSCVSRRTRIRVVTEGVLLRMLQDDPFLEAAAAIVFDEFHERSLESDLALAMVRRVRDTVRPDLKMVIMSATLDPAPLAAYLGGGPCVESHGRLHPVTIAYREDLHNRSLAERAADGVREILAQTPGDVLVFLPGAGEIRHTARHLAPLAAERNLAVLPLYGDLPPEKQDAALAPLDRRKVVLATNVAETSITIEGITGVVDAGVARKASFDPHVGLDRLQLERISQASAEQRAGRAGRTQPGVCLRLWAQRTHARRPAHEEPEIRRLDLAGAVLQLRCWGEADIQALPWFETPPESQLAQAETLLLLLDAVDARGNITELGRSMARLPVSPRLARMILAGHQLGQPSGVALAATLLAERDPFSAEEQARSRSRARTPSDSDVLDRVAALEAYEASGRLDTPLGHLHRDAARFVLRARDQLLRALRDAQGPAPPATTDADEAVLRSLLTAFPDRLVRRSDSGSQFGRMVGGRGVRLAPSSAVRGASLFLAVDVDRGDSEALVFRASKIERDWLPAAHLAERTECEFDSQTKKVVARRRTYWEDLLLDETPSPLPDAQQTAAILASAAAEALDAVLPADDSAAGEFLRRVQCLAGWMPELALPPFDAAGLRDLLPLVCLGCRSFDELRKASWLGVIQGQLTPQQRQAVERDSPERIEVPSGNRIKLLYQPGKPPVLAVRIQEVFGLLETPRIARGRVPVLLHLLGPNMRAQQVTDDLASFWRNTYEQVRKDLRRRYPKHAWPEDPYQAKAERRPQRKT